jgi:dienelactone hydrolase
MADSAVPYPPAPPNVPPALTTPTTSYRVRVTVVLASLFLFAFLYLGLVAGSAYLPWVIGDFPLPEFKPGEWHDYRVLVEGNHHRHWIDGHPTVDVIDLDEKGRRLDGVLAVQVHVGPPMTIQYKDFFLKRLPDDLPLLTPDQAKIPPAAEKVVPQGKDKPQQPRTSGPWNLERLRQAPRVTILEEGKSLTALYYEGEPYRGKPTRVFAYLARPEKAKGKRPAMVLVHGGGGTAFKEWAELWAQRGYVALAMDLAGQGADRKRLPDGGPNQDNPARFAAEQVEDFWSYHAVANVIRGTSLLASLPEVDSQRLGITGISWGGYLTCIVAGLDDRLKVAVPVYGCGFIQENSTWVDIFQKMSEAKRQRWVDNFEPSRYLGQARMPVLFVNGTNDFAYPLDSYQKSYRLVKDRTLCVLVNLPHGHPQGWAPVEIGLFVDQHLRGDRPLARIESVKRAGARVAVKFRTEVPLVRVALHYTTDAGPWQKRAWQTKEARVAGDVVRAELPTARPLVYFLTLTDRRKATVSTEHEVVDEP